jgi:hypothetical protein
MKLPRFLQIGFTVGALFFFASLPIVWSLVTIQIRLSRNVPIARGLAASLQAQFPGITARGAASYESERIYITVVSGLDPRSRHEVEQWLCRQKEEQKIAPAIWLRFGDDAQENDVIHI